MKPTSSLAGTDYSFELIPADRRGGSSPDDESDFELTPAADFNPPVDTGEDFELTPAADFNPPVDTGEDFELTPADDFIPPIDIDEEFDFTDPLDFGELEARCVINLDPFRDPVNPFQ